jgi:hypothetical protein
MLFDVFTLGPHEKLCPIYEAVKEYKNHFSLSFRTYLGRLYES